MRSMVDQHCAFVTRTLLRAGVPKSELDDEVQRTFMVAAARLDDVHLAAERRFLFQVANNVASHTRRRLARRREVSGDQAPERVETLTTPEYLAERKRTLELLEGIVDEMHESLRSVFMLSTFEEMKRTEIAAALGIPQGTVASRLRRARRQFRQHAAAVAWYREGTAWRKPQPASPRRKGRGALE